jgi:phage terminase small subunit
MPARKPRALKVMQGTLRKNREPAVPAAPRPGRARPPAWLPAVERAAFRALETETRRTGTPTRSFQHVLTGGAIAWAQLQRTTGVLGEQGDTYESETSNGARKIVVRPEVQMRAAALRLLKGFLSELGLGPVAIGRVDRAALPKEEDNAGTFLFGKRGRPYDRDTERFFG